MNENDYRLYHHGILGQKWGKRNGPPYPLKGGDYTELEKKKIREQRGSKYSIYNKKHFDQVLSKDTKLSTLSYDPNRTANTDMFYATYTKADKDQYNALFNRKIPQDIFDENGNNIGTGEFYKFRITNNIRDQIKVASEDSGADIFKDLYKNDRDFYNFVTDQNRMESLFVNDKYKFRGYREARTALNNLRDENHKNTSEDLETVYRMFNYVIPSQGKDITNQRAKFFTTAGKQGYGALLDTNDAIYGAFKANAPVIVFDSSQVIPDSVKRTTYTDKKISEFAFAGRKAFGLK